MPRSLTVGAAGSTHRLLLAAVLALGGLTAVGISTPSSAAVVDLCASPTVPAGMVRYDWIGDGPGDPNAWANNFNWQTTPARPIENNAPTYYGTPETDTSTTGYVCIDPLADGAPGSTAHINLDDTVNVHVVAIDLKAGATLDLDNGNHNSRVFVHGDPTTYVSHVRAGAAIDVAAGTLGGRGQWLVEGDVAWRSLGQGLAATFDTDVCELTPQLLACAAGGTPGVLRIGDGGLVDVNGGDVNLKDGYAISVGSGGRLKLSTGSIAANRSTALEVLSGGTFELAGDTNIYEGFLDGPAGDLAELTNAGTVVKSAGTGVSALNVDYSGDGAVLVQTGTISIANGTAAPVTVSPGRALSTATCPKGPVGGTTTCQAVTTTSDIQLAQLTVPGDQPAAVDVVLREAAANASGSLVPPVVVEVTGPPAPSPALLEFEYYRNQIPSFPSSDRAGIFLGRADVAPREIPLCENGNIPRGVTACLLEPIVRPNNRLALQVLTTRPNGEWSVRPKGTKPPALTHVAVRGAGGGFTYDNRLYVETLEWNSETGGSCGSPAGGAAVDFSHQYREGGIDADQHALVWDPVGTGRAQGLTTPVADLADVRRIDVGLDTLDDTAQGLVSLDRWTTSSVRWHGVASITRADSEPAGIPGQPRWRLLELIGLDFTWTRFTDGTADGATATGNLGEFLQDHPADKTGAAPDDDLFVGLGCDSERFALDDLRVIRATAADLRWDLEPARLTGDFVNPTTPLVGAQPGCGISFPDLPHATSRTIHLDQAATWKVRWAPTATFPDQGELRGEGSASAGNSPAPFTVARNGFVVLRLASTDQRRGSANPAYPVRAMPVIKLLKITKRVEVGQKVVVRGRVQLPVGTHRVSLYRSSPSQPLFEKVGSTVTTDARGLFTLTTKARKAGRFVYAVRTSAFVGVDAAMSNKALRGKIVPRPPRPQPQPTPVSVPVAEQPTVEAPPIGVYPRGSARTPAVCGYQFGW